MRIDPGIDRVWPFLSVKASLHFVGWIVVLSSLGCHSKPAYPGAHLAGAVSVDSQPVQEGTIAFTPTGSAHGKAVGAKISAGKYDCPYVPMGESLVQIYALRPTGKTIEVMGSKVPEMEDLVPKKDRDGIKIEVSGDNLNQDFALNSSNPKDK
jgi:hypothetical protein